MELKNFKDIVNKFDKIEKVTNHSTKPVLVVIGEKDGETISEKVTYINRKVMLEVSEKVSYFIGIEG